MKLALSPKCARLIFLSGLLAGLIWTLPTSALKAAEPGTSASLRIQKISSPLPPDMLRADLFLLRYADIPVSENRANTSTGGPSAASVAHGESANDADSSDASATNIAPPVATLPTATTTLPTVVASPSVTCPVAVLILCPSVSGNGEHFLHDPLWQAFARQHRLDLVGLSFGSYGPDLVAGRGYYYPEKGSGQALLDGLRQIYGNDLPPLLLHGFSGGSMFAGRFAEWAPERVLAWCAYAAGWWETPPPVTAPKPDKISLPSTNSPSPPFYQPHIDTENGAPAEQTARHRNLRKIQGPSCLDSLSPHPPGIVACGENDPFYGANLIYFKQGRAAGRPWLWVSLANTDHRPSGALDDFVRHYFKVILQDYLARQAESKAPQSDAPNVQASPATAIAAAASDTTSNTPSDTPSDTANKGTEPKENDMTEQAEAALTGQGLWLDVDFKTIITPAQAAQQPSLSAWLPARELLDEWLRIHKP